MTDLIRKLETDNADVLPTLESEDTELVDELADLIFGMERDVAKEKFICIKCKKKLKAVPMNEEEYEEYLRSCLCPRCNSSLLGNTQV